MISSMLHVILDFTFPSIEFVDNKKTVTQASNVNQATFCGLSLFTRNREFYQLFI